MTIYLEDTYQGLFAHVSRFFVLGRSLSTNNPEDMSARFCPRSPIMLWFSRRTETVWLRYRAWIVNVAIDFKLRGQQPRHPPALAEVQVRHQESDGETILGLLRCWRERGMFSGDGRLFGPPAIPASSAFLGASFWTSSSTSPNQNLGKGRRVLSHHALKWRPTMSTSRSLSGRGFLEPSATAWREFRSRS